MPNIGSLDPGICREGSSLTSSWQMFFPRKRYTLLILLMIQKSGHYSNLGEGFHSLSPYKCSWSFIHSRVSIPRFLNHHQLIISPTSKVKRKNPPVATAMNLAGFQELNKTWFKKITLGSLVVPRKLVLTSFHFWKKLASIVFLGGSENTAGERQLGESLVIC